MEITQEILSLKPYVNDPLPYIPQNKEHTVLLAEMKDLLHSLQPS